MTSVPFARLFSISSFEALRTLRLQLNYQPGKDLLRLADIARTLDSNATVLDFDAAFVLESIMLHRPPVNPLDDVRFYRGCIEALIIDEQPIWVKIVKLGRQKLSNNLTRDEQQCFRQAGLLTDPPNREVVEWWDRLAGQARLAYDQVKMQQARLAEELTILHEKKRLKILNIHIEPKWVAIEDNTAGYDVLSYDLGANGPVNRLLEVKSTIVSPLRFYITRNEWNQAEKFGTAYHFHVWDLRNPTPALFEFTMSEIRPHIPSDNMNGKWSNAEVPVSKH